MYFPLNGTKMQTVIFYPSEWNGHICMRIELYGCVPGMNICESRANETYYIFVMDGRAIALFPVNFSHLHYNVIQRGCEAISG